MSRSVSYRMFGTVLLLILCLISPVLIGQQEPEVGAEKGQMYPDFHLPRLNGTSGQLSDYRGKKVILFQFASW